MIIFLCVIYIFIPGIGVEETYFEYDKQFLPILKLIFKLIDRRSCSFSAQLCMYSDSKTYWYLL